MDHRILDFLSAAAHGGVSPFLLLLVLTLLFLVVAVTLRARLADRDRKAWERALALVDDDFSALRASRAKRRRRVTIPPVIDAARPAFEIEFELTSQPPRSEKG
jgi:hypothetical protein